MPAAAKHRRADSHASSSSSSDESSPASDGSSSWHNLHVFISRLLGCQFRTQNIIQKSLDLADIGETEGWRKYIEHNGFPVRA